MIKSHARAFTLIELLIVVAIIAILAAIAVPNFLEAQTRSKVSRARADMRSIATALESYAVDNTKYPPSAIFVGQDYYESLSSEYPESAPNVGFGGPTLITTPVAYITAYPRDPFIIQSDWASNPLILSGTKRVKGRPFLLYNIEDENTRWTNAGFDYLWGSERNSGYKHALASVGPAGNRWWYSMTQAQRVRGQIPSYLLPYDPTNGTVSDGAIFRLGPGSGENFQ